MDVAGVFTWSSYWEGESYSSTAFVLTSVIGVHVCFSPLNISVFFDKSVCGRVVGLSNLVFIHGQVNGQNRFV